MTIELVSHPDLSEDELVGLYDAVGWTAYTKGEARTQLADAVRNSTYVVAARDDGRLVGLARVLTDGVAICYLQDILVDPDQQRTGVGRRLLEHCLDRYADVRMHVLMTDDEPKQRAFYQSLGYQNTRDLKKVTLNTFVRAKNGPLS